MAWFVASIVFGLIAVALIVVGALIRPDRHDYNKDEWESGKSWSYRIGAGLIVFALLLLLVSSLSVVGTKKVGVVTEFGHPSAELSNGLHFKAPWGVTHQMDAAVQPESFVQDQRSGDPDHRCIDVRLGNLSIGCAEVRFNWQIQPSDAMQLYQNYRSFDHLRSTLVLGAARSALNHAFADYNPINLLVANKNYTDILPAKAALVQQAMRDEIGARINVSNVIIPIVLFDQATQDNINNYQAQVGKTRVADQAVLTAQQQAKANEILAKSLQQTGVTVLISKCLDLVAEGKTVPGWCFPPGSNVLVSPGGAPK
jgi:regulator of protease activity HflC (stomatin/prohibitin superfamily)